MKFPPAEFTALEARLLGIRETDPCLIMVRRTFSRDAVITLDRKSTRLNSSHT